MDNSQMSQGNQSDQARDQEQVKNPNTMEQQDFQPDTGIPEDREALRARRRNNLEGAERVKQADGEATEEA